MRGGIRPSTLNVVAGNVGFVHGGLSLGTPYVPAVLPTVGRIDHALLGYSNLCLEVRFLLRVVSYSKDHS